MFPATSKSFPKVTHCIFDNDGTLMDTEEIYAQAMEHVLKLFGVTLNTALKHRLRGRPSADACKLVRNETLIEIDNAEMAAQYLAEAARLLTNVKPMPGVWNLMQHLNEMRVPTAIATSSPQYLFRQVWAPHCDLMSTFRHIVCGDDPQLKRGKPAPDIYLLAASRFNPQPRPECCLVFEDSPTGMQAGIAAGMQVVFIPDPQLDPQLRKGATVVLRSMADFDPERFGLPAFDCGEKFTFG